MYLNQYSPNKSTAPWESSYHTLQDDKKICGSSSYIFSWSYLSIFCDHQDTEWELQETEISEFQ